jgi:glutathione synthase/RimK-type ligase-like ATP-grasp enzyme
MTVAIATCAELPKADPDEPLLRQALARAGIAAEWVPWSDPAADWARYELVVVRSTWDYTFRLPEFLSWAQRLPRLLNPAEILTWNTDKTYLREVAAWGLPTVPTTWIMPDGAAELPATGEFVVKPTVAAGARGAGRFRGGDPAALAHVAHLQHAGHSVMVQPYLSEVDTSGETALVYFDGSFSHSVSKAAILPPGPVDKRPFDAVRLPVGERISSRAASPEQREIGDRAVELLGERFGTTPLYARIDLLPARSGPAIVEVELTEPSLFLDHHEAAADRLVDALRTRLGP